MKSTIFIGMALFLGVGACPAEPSLPMLRVLAHVVDENGHPVSTARVKFVFGTATDANASVNVTILTDDSGKAVAEGYSDGSLGGVVSKAGYYMSGISIPPLADIVNRKSQEVEAHSILRPVGNPVAMYVNGEWLDVPVADRPCGFDLETGDWVAPYGKGAASDLILTLSRQYISRENFGLTIVVTFSNLRDGIQETKSPDFARNSVFKGQREAPESGYNPSLTSRFAHQPGGTYDSTATEGQNYIFRIRTVERDGRIVSALYGKISGGLELALSNSKTCKVHLTYYLNPTPLDRNLEWDVHRNMFPHPGDDTPRLP